MRYQADRRLRSGALFIVAAPLMLLGAGHATAEVRADFNGDGFDDLAIGVPGEDLQPNNVFATVFDGAVNVLYGSASGLTSSGDQFWHQDSPGVRGEVGLLDLFGGALAVGDFDGDGYDDLAIGAPWDTVPDGAGGSIPIAGAVNVLYGSFMGLTADGDQFWHQNSPGVKDKAESEVGAFFVFGDAFGRALATGDFNGDGKDDLAIGAPLEDLPNGAGGSIQNAGAVNVLYGSAKGLTSEGDQFWHQDRSGVKDKAQAFDIFGDALAAGDFNNDGLDDLAIGAAGEDLPGGTGGRIEDAGAVHVLYGSRSGLTANDDQFWHQNRSGVKNKAQTDDRFGDSLAVGDFDGNGADDLAIGVPSEDLPDTGGRIKDAGAVNVLYGSLFGLTSNGDQLWHQNSPGVTNRSQRGDRFGAALTAGDFDNDGRDDLAIGVPSENLPKSTQGTIFDAGAVNLLYGAAGGLTSSGDQFWHQDSPSVRNKVEEGDGFGGGLSAGDFDNDGRDDLAIGVPFEDLPNDNSGSIVDAGAVNVLYGSGSGLTAGGDQLWHQDRPRVKDKAEAGDGFGIALP